MYFESLEGIGNPGALYPDERRCADGVQARYGADPLALFQNAALADKDKVQRAFLDYRAALARQQQGEWMSVLEGIRRKKPYLDLAVTQIDDRFDNRVHDLLGADASLTLPMLEEHDFTYLIEDPATSGTSALSAIRDRAKYQPLDVAPVEAGHRHQRRRMFQDIRQNNKLVRNCFNS